jgi:hypothetical protein
MIPFFFQIARPNLAWRSRGLGAPSQIGDDLVGSKWPCYSANSDMQDLTSVGDEVSFDV